MHRFEGNMGKIINFVKIGWEYAICNIGLGGWALLVINIKRRHNKSTNLGQ